MNGINKAFLLGTVGSDPETKTFGENSRVSRFRMATNDSYKDKTSGEKKETTEWHSVDAWGFLSDLAGSYIRKGTNLVVEGKIKTETYDDKDGKKVYRTKIVADNIHLLPDGKKHDAQQNQQQDYQQPTQQPIYQQPVQQPVYQQPIQQPIYQQPVQQQPVYQQPVQQQPVYQQPAQQQPVYQQPAQQQNPQQPTLQQPRQASQSNQQPIRQQGFQQPVQQQAIRQVPQNPISQQQIQQAQQQVQDYTTDEQFMNTMQRTEDDLPF